MSASNSALPSFFNTDADFRTWAQAIHDALTAAGWVNTSDTGQINLSTVTKPGAANTSQGYEIWHMNDSFQGSNPYFIKVEYGSHTSSADRPGLWITVGTGSNGTGTLNGNVGTRTQCGQNIADSAGTTRVCYFSGGTDRFCMFGGYTSGASTGRYVWCVERTADGTGTTTTDGCLLLTKSGANKISQVLNQSTAVVNGTSGATFLKPDPTNNGDFTNLSNNVALIPFIYCAGKPLFSRCLATYKDADITSATAISVSVGGGTHTYMPIGATPAAIDLQNGNTGPLAFLYE